LESCGKHKLNISRTKRINLSMPEYEFYS
jgi:hypothetical protein